MRASDELFRLVKSLDKNEKGYFKKYCSGSGTVTRKYLELFDLIERAEKYDEQKLKKKITDKKLLRNFASEKNYLHHLLLESLVASARFKRKRDEMDLLLAKARILAERSFYNESLKLVLKVRTYCEAIEATDLHLAALDEEWQLWPFCDKEKRREIETIISERESVLRQSLVTDYVRARYSRMLDLFRTIGMGRSEEQLKQFEAVFREAGRFAKKNTLGIKAKIYWLEVNAYYYNVRGELPECYRQTHKLIAAFNENPPVIDVYQSMYISALNNYILLQLYLGHFEEAPATLEKIEKLKPFTKKDQNAVFVCRYNSHMELYLKTLRFDEAWKYACLLRDELPVYTDRIPNRFLGHITYWAFKSSFYNTKLKDALYWMNRLLNAPPENPFPPEVVTAARLSELILHCDLGHTDLLESYVRSAKHFLDKNSGMYELESMFIACFEEHLRDPAGKKPFRKFYDTLQKLEGTVFEQRLFAYFDFDSWAESRFSGKPMQDLVKKKYREARKK
ncbi:MAG: hypothetical protein FD123_3181 [Bacteroidetes bacterium]|nr:MAG: hypothetical protein FD123_3181 [Bacteroidota bacterium]